MSTILGPCPDISYENRPTRGIYIVFFFGGGGGGAEGGLGGHWGSKYSSDFMRSAYIKAVFHGLGERHCNNSAIQPCLAYVNDDKFYDCWAHHATKCDEVP